MGKAALIDQGAEGMAARIRLDAKTKKPAKASFFVVQTRGYCTGSIGITLRQLSTK